MYSKSSEPSMRRFSLSSFVQIVLVFALLSIVTINIRFLISTQKRHSANSKIIVQTQRVHSSESSVRKLQVISSKNVVAVLVDGIPVYQDDTATTGRGIHVIVLSQQTLSVMARRVFDTYLEHQDKDLVTFVDMITDGRILIFAVKDEGSFNLKAPVREYLKTHGSLSIHGLHWRDMWAFATVKSGISLNESISKSPQLDTWGKATSIFVNIFGLPEKVCSWYAATDVVSRRRRTFCEKYEGYDRVCQCVNKTSLIFYQQPKSVFMNLINVPVTVIASNRPYYLYRCLHQLLSTAGCQPHFVTVFIDGFNEDMVSVAQLFGVRAYYHTPLGVKNARISQHYKSSLTATFTLFPDAKYMIILEEDLLVSPDFFNYFDQLIPLMATDPTIYCISAWNDQGYEHSCKDPSLLYRIETMPGLGWLLSRSLFINELQPNWPTPEKQWDWDMWMRGNHIRKDRECVIPDISRTYHFGKSGLNVNPYFQEVYFQKHAFLTLSSVKLMDISNLYKDKYNLLLENLIKTSIPLNHSRIPCHNLFIPSTSNAVYSVYITMQSLGDYTSWLQLAKCFHIWDLDSRGFHQGVWRLFMKSNHIIVIGVPASPFARMMPDHIIPLDLKPTSTQKP